MATVCDYLKDDQVKDALVKTKYMALQKPGMQELIQALIPYVNAGDVQGFHAVWDAKKEWVYQELGEYADLFTLVVFDAQVDDLLEKHAALKVPVKITKDTLSDFQLWTQRFKKAYRGRCGFDGTDWLLLHMSGQLFRIGRLQYRILDFPGEVEGYRHKQTGKYLVVATDGVSLNKDGKLSNDVTDGFQTTYQKKDGWLSAHVVDEKTGQVSKIPQEIDLNAYTCVIQPGDKVIDMHIPEDGRMEYKAIRESMERAVQFFEAYFPEHTYRAFHIYSWLLCNELQEILSANTNIMRLSHLFTGMISGTGTHEYVYPWIFGFDKNPADYKATQAKTTLQKGAKKLLEEGRWFTERSGFMLIER